MSLLAAGAVEGNLRSLRISDRGDLREPGRRNSAVAYGDHDVHERLERGSNPSQIQLGAVGDLWFSDRSGAIGRITPGGVITEFTSGLNPGSSDPSIVAGPDGNLWFSDNGTTKAIGTIIPTTQAISEFSSGLTPESFPIGIAAGPDATHHRNLANRIASVKAREAKLVLELDLLVK
jgi:streptogramin lyase